MKPWTTLLILLALSLGGSLGCIRRADYNARVAELGVCSGQLGKCQQDLASAQTRIAQLDKEQGQLKTDLQTRTDKANLDLSELQKQLDEATALNASLREELGRKGADVDKLLKEKGALSSSLEQAKVRLEELRKAQAAAERRAEMFRQLIERFRTLSNAGQMQVVSRRGRLVLQLPNDVLFDSGKAELKEAGKKTLIEIAKVLKEIPNRQFQVAGHTDAEPIRSSRFPSNWHLSSARAIRVVELLVDQGLNPQTLSATGYGEFDPLVANDSPANRARNRRIEIVLQPNMDELLGVDAPKAR